jgi:hypothetical protein
MPVEELTAEPTPVTLHEERCPRHHYRYISMPREENGDCLNFVAKCPLSACTEGISKPRND